MLHDPAVLVLDEPTAGLDVLASRFLRDFVRAERDRGKAVVFSTHYLAEAELLCDRIGLLHQGRLLAEGTPAALRATAGDAPSLEEAFLRLVAAVDAPGAARRRRREAPRGGSGRREGAARDAARSAHAGGDGAVPAGGLSARVAGDGAGAGRAGGPRSRRTWRASHSSGPPALTAELRGASPGPS